MKVEEYELFDLEKAVRSVPYAEQKAHYHDGEDAEAAVDNPAAVPVGAASASSEW